MAAAGAPGASGNVAYLLSTEFKPAHEGPVQAVAVLSNDVVVTGGDDDMVTVWRRINTTNDFSSVHMCPEHKAPLRAILPIPAGAAPGFEAGGFATASLDKAVRLYSFDPATAAVALVRTLVGHLMGVISLSWTARGELVSGGWEGHVRVWDVATGACKQVLEGHENGTCVLGLANGNIAVGSTGRKNEHNQHVDFQIRLWRHTSADGPPCYVILKALRDHEQAVMDLAALPGGAGFVSVANDGTCKVRSLDGAVLDTFVNPVSDEGRPYAAMRCAVLPDGTIATSSDDNAVRLYAGGQLCGSIVLPGQPWRLAGLPNADIVVGCGQAGFGKRGHVYTWTRDAARAADEIMLAAYTADMVPPSKPKSAAAAGGGDAMEINGPYEMRGQIPGAADGQYGFFQRTDGSVMVCMWSAAATAWTDVGIVQDGPGGDDGGGAAGGAGGGGGDGAAAAPGAGTGSKAWDYSLAVTMDTAQGTRSMQLCFNDGDDANTVAHTFVNHNGLSVDTFEEVRNFILENKALRAAEFTHKRAAAAAAAYQHLPSRAYLDHTVVDWKKVYAKVLELNATVAASNDANVAALALAGKPDEDSLKALVDVLGETSRYHATTVPRASVRLLVNKLLRWPLPSVFPAVDTLRVLVAHPDGAAAVAEVAGAGWLAAELDRLRAARSVPDLRPVVLLTARTLFNAFRHGPTRALLAARQADVLDAVGDLLQYDNAAVKFAAAVLLHNFAHMYSQAAKAAAGGSDLMNADCGQQAIALISEGLTALAADPDATGKLLVALGTLVLAGGAEYAATARSLDLEAAAAAAADRATATPVVKAIAAEVAKVLKKES